MAPDGPSTVCDNCGATAPAGGLRPWLQYADDELRHLPRYARARELKLCSDCFEAARDDERETFRPAHHLTLVLGVLFFVVLAATLIFPTLWTGLARYTYGMSHKEEVFERQHQDQNPTPWGAHKFGAPTDTAVAPSPSKTP